MDLQSAMGELEAGGSEQTRKTYARHGVLGPMFGVSYATLGALKKQIGTDHALSHELWATGNHDARVLATMIADPAQIDAALIESWAGALDNYVLADALVKVVAESPVSTEQIENWCNSETDWYGQLGWSILAVRASKNLLDDEYCRDKLRIIEERIHSAGNRTKYSMNQAIICIGLRNPAMQEAAIATARRVGKVEVDHGDTDCQTPDAEAYILKTASYRAQMEEKRAQAAAAPPNPASLPSKKPAKRAAKKPARKAPSAAKKSKKAPKKPSKKKAAAKKSKKAKKKSPARKTKPAKAMKKKSAAKKSARKPAGKKKAVKRKKK